MEWLGREKELRWPVETGEAVKGAEVRLECRWSPVEAPESSSTLQPIAAEDGAAGPEGTWCGFGGPSRHLLANQRPLDSVDTFSANQDAI